MFKMGFQKRVSNKYRLDMQYLLNIQSNRRQSKIFKMNHWRKLHDVRSIKYGSGMLCLLNTVQQETIT